MYNPRAPFLFETTPARYHPPTYPLLEAPIDTYYPPPPPPLSQPVFDPPSRPTSSIYRSPPLAPHVLANVASSRIRTSSQPPSAIYRARHSPDYDPLPTAASAPNTPPRQGRPGTHRAQSHQDVPVLSKESLASLHRAVSDRTLHHALASPLQETATRSSSVTSARPKGVGKYYITRGGGRYVLVHLWFFDTFADPSALTVRSPKWTSRRFVTLVATLSGDSSSEAQRLNKWFLDSRPHASTAFLLSTRTLRRLPMPHERARVSHLDPKIRPLTSIRCRLLLMRWREFRSRKS